MVNKTEYDESELAAGLMGIICSCANKMKQRHRARLAAGKRQQESELSIRLWNTKDKMIPIDDGIVEYTVESDSFFKKHGAPRTNNSKTLLDLLSAGF